jgi:tetratricopeptide (TPR) repeat protein
MMLKQYINHQEGRVGTESISEGREHADKMTTASPPGLTTINSENKNVADVLTESGIVEVLREVIKEEITSYKQSIFDNPDDAELYRRLGILKLLLKKRRSALKEYKVLKNMFPSMADELMRKWNIKTPF